MCIPEAHSTRTSLAPNPRVGNSARLSGLAVLAAGREALRLGGRAGLPQPAEGPGDLDAAADTPEPDESDDRCRKEDVQHGEDIRIAPGGWEYKFKDMEYKAAGMGELGRYTVRLGHT